MIEYFFFTIVFLLSTLGVGFFFKNKILKLRLISIGEIGIIGLFSISFVLTFFHFFLSISDELVILILLISVFYYFLNFRILISKFIKENYLILIFFLTSLFIFFNHEPNEDFGLYHLPYIINLKSEKIIFGLSNLQLNQGWNSIWLNLHSYFAFSFNEYKTIYILNIIFFIFINCIFITNIFSYRKDFSKNNENPEILIKYFSIFFFSFFNVKYARLNTYGIDVPSNYLVILSILYFIKVSYFNENRLTNLKILYLLVIFAFMSRISNALFLLLPIYLTFKLNYFNKIFKSKTFIFLFLFCLTWVSQQFIYTGCFVFPYTFFCSVQPFWYDVNFIDNFKLHTFYVNKSYSSYTGTLNIDEYHRALNWLPTWFERTKIEMIEYLIAFVIPVFFIIYKRYKKINNLNRSLFFNISFAYLFIIVLSSLILWFLNSPVIRMGSHFIFIIIFFIIFILLNFFGQLRFELSKKILYFLIISVFIFSIQKNISRIKDKNTLLAFFPKFESINYKTINVNGYPINRVIDGSTIQSRVCWNVPFLCSTSNDFSIKSLKSYLFILK